MIEKIIEMFDAIPDTAKMILIISAISIFWSLVL